MLKLDDEEKAEILNLDLLCLYETWHTKTKQLPEFLQDSHILAAESFAIKNKQVGRASGGIMIITSKTVEYVIIEASEYWILLRIKINLEYFTLGIFYFKPSLDDNIVIEMLEDVLHNLDIEQKVILAGDFNSRIGNLNYVEEELLDGTGVNEERISKDSFINKRGEKLVGTMEMYGMIALNGRVAGDIPAEFTFVDKRGTSVVDLVWVNIEVAAGIKELKVTTTSLLSDHLPLRLQLEGDDGENSTETRDEHQAASTIIEFVTWNEEKKMEFTREIENHDTGNTYHDLKSAIDGISRKLNLISHRKIKKIPTKCARNKIWYNTKCRTAKHRIKQEYRKWKRKETNSIQSYIEAKKLYKDTVKEEEKLYMQNLQKILADVRHTSQFWKAIKQFRKKNYHQNKIDIFAWNQ